MSSTAGASCSRARRSRSCKKLWVKRPAMKLTSVLRRPLITEKTTVLREDGRTLVFQVAMDANKIDIKKAVESLLGSKVQSVRTSLAHGKFKRQIGRAHV